jgi:hypothetical protein
MKPVVFLGPTLPVDAARAYLDATYLPPAQQGDLISALYARRPSAIGLIDGYFFQSLSVWHKEILDALGHGIPVYGASSIGALRAAETCRYGMRGVGRVFEMYRSGVLQDDDEVALAHTGPDDGYRALSLPMVNVRATLDLGRAEGLLDERWHEQCLVAAKSIYFRDRTAEAVARVLQEAGAPAGVRDTVLHVLRHSYVDVKQQDAIELLTLMNGADARGAEQSPVLAAGREPEQPRSLYLLRTLKNRDRTVQDDGVAVSLSHVAETAALHHPDFPALMFHSLNRAVACVLARMLGVTLGEADLAEEEQRLRQRLAIGSAEEMSRWLRANDLSAGDWSELLEELALCSALHRWQLAAHITEGNTRNVLNELRLTGEYEKWRALAAAEARSVPEEALQAAWNSGVSLAELIAEHAAATGVAVTESERPDEAGFECLEDLRIALLRSRLARISAEQR